VHPTNQSAGPGADGGFEEPNVTVRGVTTQFFVVGAQRCGTTYLYRLLDDHPEIEMARPERPEPKYFLTHDPGPAGTGAYLAGHFSAAPVRARGEKGTTYLDVPASWPRMLRAFPDARFVVILRDPVARAVSHWRFSTDNGLEHLPAERALTDESLAARPFDGARVSTSPYAYLQRGRYATALARLFEVVGRRRTLVVFLEELVADPAVASGVYGFVGADPHHRPRMADGPVNTSAPRAVPDWVTAALARYYEGPNRALARLLGRPLPPSWRAPDATRGAGGR
jgi:hypothetical protein